MIFLFDLSGVIFNDGRKEAVSHIHEVTGLSAESLDQALFGVSSMAYRIGEESCDDFWNKMQQTLEYNDIATVRSIFFDSYRPDPQIIYMLGMIRSCGHRVGFVSNSPEDRMVYLEEKFRFRDHFDFGVCSYEAHAWKPDPAIFRFLIDTNHLNAKEILYIDDRENNLKSAAQLGMQTLHFTGHTILMLTLKRLGIK